MFENESDDLRTIKGLPFWQAFLAAIIAPIIIVIVFGILGAKTNALLLQLELLIIAIAFCLTGILARSKSVGLLSIFAAPISWVVLFILDMLTQGFIINPYGLASGLADPLSAILESDIIGGMSGMIDADTILMIMIVLDLFIVEFLAFFLGFFLSTLATGIWTKKGDLSIFSVIIKPIAAIFTIMLLITVPLIYHGLFSFANGGISLAAGTTEFMSVFGVNNDGGAGAQEGIDLSDPEEIQKLSEAAARAAEWFRKSSTAFDHVQGNFYVTILVGMLPDNYEGLNLQELPLILDISEILAEVSNELPHLLLGYNNLVEGFNLTFTVLGDSDIGGGSGSSIDTIEEANYDPDFNVGLKKIAAAIGNFSASKDGVTTALNQASDIIDTVIVDETGNLAGIVSVIGEAETGYGIILEVAAGALSFLNATYKTTLAVEDLGDTDFESAHDWMDDAAIDLTEANTTLQAIDTEGLEEDSMLPFWGTVEIITDMTELLTYFARAATNGTECYMNIEDVVLAINNLDFSSGDLDEIISDLNQLSINVTETRETFNGAKNNIGNATELSESFITKSYGDIIDGSLKPMLNDFNGMLNKFYTNITEIEHLIAGLDYTIDSALSFTEGLNLFNQTYNAIRDDVGADGPAFFTNFSTNPDVDRSKAWMDFAIDNASNGYVEIDTTSVISGDVTTEWKNTLHYPYPPANPDETIDAPIKSIAGLALGVKNFIIDLESISDYAEQEQNNGWIQTLFDNMDDVGFDQIFGGG
ncbi:MAG: hypothetical protein ACXADY_05940 [Candidatus Hodarchaeales archaeon]|jgi:hypothetical protein